jgi:hypothetical protein
MTRIKHCPSSGGWVVTYTPLTSPSSTGRDPTQQQQQPQQQQQQQQAGEGEQKGQQEEEVHHTEELHLYCQYVVLATGSPATPRVPDIKVIGGQDMTGVVERL